MTTPRWLWTACLPILLGNAGAPAYGKPKGKAAKAPKETPPGLAKAVSYSNYSEETPPKEVQWSDVCADGTSPKMGNLDESLSQDSSPIEVPFPFHFYAGTYTTLRASTNGWLSFSRFLTDSAVRRASGRAKLPTFGAPNAAIYAFWEDLSLRDEKGICYATVGKPGSRSFVVQWNNVYFGNNTPADGSLTFQVRLNEKDDTIDLLYQTVTPGNGRDGRPKEATIGVEDEGKVPGEAGQGGSRATVSSQTPAAGLRIRFVPKP